MKIANRVLTAKDQGLANDRKANARENIGAQVKLDASAADSNVNLVDVKDADGNVVSQKISVVKANDGKLTIHYMDTEGESQTAEFSANTDQDTEISIVGKLYTNGPGLTLNDNVFDVNSEKYYDKDQIDAKLRSRAKFVEELPSSGDASYIYYVGPKADVPEGRDRYDVYEWDDTAKVFRLVDESTIEINDLVGATAETAGTHGLVPQPQTTDVDKFLRGNGVWDDPIKIDYAEEEETLTFTLV